MSADLAEQLQSSLGATYTIVRELGGGGMSRVFLADDKALGRQVVIKVLHPELAAGVNAERFNREVQLSARLQHPHIVPVLTAGEVDGLPYYVMPFVKGESLRARIAAGPMPVQEVISIVADVAKALAYAQSDGVVHRDIKPDNILLSGGAATVADFGIAKAIAAAKRGDRPEGDSPKDPWESDSLTVLGTSLGTPAYMAPEQVAGDPNVDHRADIYSLGCVAYEMLTGQAPFAGKSPQQMLAAHVMEKPVPLEQKRPGLPPALVTAINRCLEKEPANRPQSASELVTQIETSGAQTVVSPAVVARARSKIPTWAVVAGVVILGAAAVPAYRALRPAAAVPDGTLSVAVAPFEVLDPQLTLWKEGMVDVLSRNLDGAGPIRSIPPSVSVKKWEGHADRTVATAFGKKVGANLVVYGQLQPAGRDLVDVKAWVLDTQRDAAPIEVQFRDSTARMDRVTDSLSVKVLAAISRDHRIGTGKLASLGSGSLPAIKAFLQGSQYYRRTRWDSATSAFKEAVALDSTFGVAYLHLAQSLGWSSGSADPGVADAYRHAGRLIRPGLPPRDSLALAAAGHYANIGRNGVRNMDEVHAAIAAAKLATQLYPKDPEAWYFYADMRLHSDATIGFREALSYFDKAIEADSDFAVAYPHAIELAHRYGGDAGRRYAQAYLRRDPKDFEGEGVRLAALATDPRTSAAELNAAIDTLPPRVVQKAFTALSRMPDTTEMALKIMRAALKRIGEASNPNGFLGILASQLAMRGHIDEAWPLAVKARSYTAGEIAALGLIPADSAMKVLRPWLTEQNDAFVVPFPILAMVGDTATLLGLTKTMEGVAQRDTARRAIFNYITASLRAYTALARHDTTAATALFNALPDTVISFPVDLFMRARLLGRTDPHRAIALLERYSAQTDLMFAAREL
jgi:serine/threonine-protein kinase